jgi:hypothetical protein
VETPAIRKLSRAFESSNRPQFPTLFVVVLVSLSFQLHAQSIFDPSKLPSDWASPSFLKPRLLSLAGKGARDCRTAFSTQDARDATSCALNSFSLKTPFYVQYDLPGIDTELRIGFAFDGKAVYAVVGYRLQQYWRQQDIIDVERCPLPMRLYTTETGKLNCFSLDAMPRNYLLSPEWGSY